MTKQLSQLRNLSKFARGLAAGVLAVSLLAGPDAYAKKAKTVKHEKGNGVELEVKHKTDRKDRVRRKYVEAETQTQALKAEFRYKKDGTLKSVRAERVDAEGNVHKDKIRCKKQPELCKNAVKATDMIEKGLTNKARMKVQPATKLTNQGSSGGGSVQTGQTQRMPATENLIQLAPGSGAASKLRLAQEKLGKVLGKQASVEETIEALADAYLKEPAKKTE